MTTKSTARIGSLVALVLLAAGATYVALPRERQESRAMRMEAWAGLGGAAGGVEVDLQGDLQALAQASDVVVVATVESVSLGRTYTSALDESDVVQYGTIHLRVLQHLGGTMGAPETVPLQTFISEERDLDVLSRELDGLTGLFFLHEVTSFGEGRIDNPPIGPIYRLLSSQGLVVPSTNSEAAGRALVPLWLDEGFPRDLEGELWTDVIKEVESYVDPNVPST